LVVFFRNESLKPSSKGIFLNLTFIAGIGKNYFFSAYFK